MRRKVISISLLIAFILVISLSVYLKANYATPILMYHSLDAERVKDYAAVSPNNFLKQMEYIAKHNYKVISLEEYCRLLKTGQPIPRKAVVLTFDDGHKDNLGAFKILKQFDYTATFFIIAKKINKPGYLSMEDIDLALKNPKIKIGSHTINEAYLPDLSPKELRREVADSKIILEKLFFQEVNTFSYTIGGYTKEALKEVGQAGYLCACTTNRGFSKKLDRFALRRIKITDRDSKIRLWGKLSGFYNSFRKPKKPF